MVGAAISARSFYSISKPRTGTLGRVGQGSWDGERNGVVLCKTPAPIPPRGTLTMLAILPQVLSVWMAKDDKTFSMERPFTITM